VKNACPTWAVTNIFQMAEWYSWVDSNRRPPDPQSGALTN
jgi:hypothetical protein